MKNLIPLIEFICEVNKNRMDNFITESTILSYNKIITYTEFLKQPLELWMFLPCKLVDSGWTVLNKPKDYEDILLNGSRIYHYDDICDANEYQKALDKMLFEGLKFKDVQPSTEYNYYHINGYKIFEANNQYKFFPYGKLKTVEDLVQYKLKLTQNTYKK